MTSTDRFDVPMSLIHKDDDAPALRKALEAYDVQSWKVAKLLLEPLARAGNRLALFKFANTLDSLGDSAGAEHFWRLAVSGGDTNAGINLAILLEEQGRNHEEIIQLYKRAIDAGNLDAIRNLALYVEDDDPAWADELFLEAVRKGDAKSCANLALTRFTDGNVSEALRFAEMGYERGNMYSVTAIALHHTHNQDWESAIVEARRALTLSTPDNIEDQKHPYKLIALSLIQLSRIDEAQQAIQDCYDNAVPEADDLSNLLDLMRESLENNEPQESEVRPNFCTQCGGKTEANNLFCSNCGHKL